MRKSNVSKEEFERKVGKKLFLEDDINLSGILEYNNGIKYFDTILNGKTIKQFNAVIHFHLFPKGYVIKIAKLFSSFSYPLPFNDITIVDFIEKEDLYISNINTIEGTLTFSFKKGHFNEVINFIKKSKINYNIKIDNNSVSSNNAVKKQTHNYNQSKRKS